MIFKKKRFYRPFYKQFLKVRKNIQNRIKIFKFNKQKWERIQFYSRKQLKFYKRYRIRDQFKESVTKFASRGNSFQKLFRNSSNERKLFSLFYGGLNKNYLKTQTNSIKNSKSKILKFQNYKYIFVKFFESRLDTVLYRSCFSLSIRGARQLIFHGHILVNGSIIRTHSYILKTNDLIEVRDNEKSRKLILKNIDKSNFWPTPPKYLIINYTTLQIIFLYEKHLNLVPFFNHYLNINSVINNIKKY